MSNTENGVADATPAPGALAEKRLARAKIFTDRKLAELPVPTDKKQAVIADPLGSGASYRLQETGRAAFIYAKRQRNGQRFNTTLGPVPPMTVEEARADAAILSLRIARGDDLVGEERARKAALKDAQRAAKAAEPESEAAKRKVEEARFTVRKMLRKWSHEHLATRRPGYSKRAEQVAARVLGDWLDVEPEQVSKREVRARLDLFNGRGQRRFAASVVVSIFNLAAKKDWININPLANFDMPEMPPERERTLVPWEAQVIYTAMDALPYPEGPFLRLLMLTACRRAEIAGLRWDEVQDDEDGKVLLIPPERTKTGRITKVAHRVPLSLEAWRIIASVPRVVGCRYVFSRNGVRPITHFDRMKDRLDAEVTRLADVEPFVLHDFRRSVATILASKGFDPIAVDMLLGHVPTGLSQIARIYNRYQHADTRRKALEAWAKLIIAPIGDNVRTLCARSDDWPRKG
jgi:integrase